MTAPTPEQVAALRALAEAATPGPWDEGYWDGQWHVESPDVLIVQEVERVPDEAQAGVNATFIAAADPATIQALCADWEAKVATVKVLQQSCKRWQTERNALVAEVERLKTEVVLSKPLYSRRQLQERYDALKAELDWLKNQHTTVRPACNNCDQPAHAGPCG